MQQQQELGFLVVGWGDEQARLILSPGDATQFTLDSHQALTDIDVCQQISDLVELCPEFY